MKFDEEESLWLQLVEEGMGPEQLKITRPVVIGPGRTSRWAYVWMISCPESQGGNPVLINHGLQIDRVNDVRWKLRAWGCGREISFTIKDTPSQSQLIALLVILWQPHQKFMDAVRGAVQ